MECGELTKQQQNVDKCFLIYEKFNWLLNCYVLDFFTDNHWNKLSKNWQSSLGDLSAIDIANLLDFNTTLTGKTWPLSILALKSIITDLSLPRSVSKIYVQSFSFLQDEKVLKLFWKNVKEKKRHEISVISEVCYASGKETDCFYIVDIGSGLGHLSRMLNYGYGFKVCTIEVQQILSQQAQFLDHEFEYFLKKKYPKLKIHERNVHVNKKIESTITPEEFLLIIKKAFKLNCDNFKFGIVGLHPCGDLGAILLKLYNNCSNAVFINIVGCCYMKLTTLPNAHYGFPLSAFCRSKKHILSYHSREIACHAIENYIKKLRQNECWKLKIHTYRAMLEKIITEECPEYHHCALNSVKYTENLTFASYCKKATKKIPIEFPQHILKTNEVEICLNEWKKVVAFYSLRLLFAPLVESIILRDRLMYVLESGSHGEIVSVFDPHVSPRTHVLTARKNVILSKE